MWLVSALAFKSASKLVLFVVMPGCVLPEITFLSMRCHVLMSVRTSWRVAPLISMCRGGLGGPFKMAWKMTFFRRPCERKRLATVHSWMMSNLPASCRLWKSGLVFPEREKRMNSRVKCWSLFCYFLFLPFKLACWLGVKWAYPVWWRFWRFFSVKIMICS